MVVFVKKIENEVIVHYGNDPLVGGFFLFGVEMLFH